MYEKIIAFILILYIMSPALHAFADVIQVNTELEGFETEDRLFNREVYEAPCEHPGTVVKVTYTK